MLTIHMILLVWDHILLKCLHVPSQESERSCIRVLGVSILPLSTILIFDFGIVPTVWYFFIVPTVWYFFIVPTVWYFFIVPTVRYFFSFSFYLCFKK
jgi:hypothetical protein